MSSMRPYDPTREMPGDASPLEAALNSVSDQDASWWPFVELRPEPSAPMTNAHVGKMSLCYGPMLAMILLAVSFHELTSSSAIPIVLGSIVLTFLIYRVTFAVAWNRRAARLRD